MMNKQKIYDYLNSLGIDYEITEHQAVYTMSELCDVAVPHPEADAKNLFIRDDKHLNYYLITVRGDKRVNLKDFRREHGTRPLSFASPEELMTLMSLTPGSVTPLGLLNDSECRIQFFLDSDFCTEPYLIGIHPCDNTATVWLKTDDLIKIIKDHGNSLQLVKIQ